MKRIIHSTATLLAGLGIAGAASAAEIFVTTDIAVSETWTANNTYNLQDRIYILAGATLTIEPGTVIASSTGLDNAIVVTRGAKLIAIGTASNPIIFTSKADVATWTPDGSHPTGGDPATGAWRVGAAEWGNVTMLGKGFISESKAVIPANVETCAAGNVATMEGLTVGGAIDQYGGGDDNDDSGSLQFVSLRFGGKVEVPGVELNGLSLGGIGRETDIDHIEIMNNVDDGIEIWGGTVNLKHVSIWNVGDDSFDIDQGWRGQAQFGLVVQGYSAVAVQGSGVGDNCLELDGAENADYQPVTTATLYNFTVIGQPLGGDHGSAWRDNARVQIRNSIFMDVGERIVRPETGGDGGEYGLGGTLGWNSTWTTAVGAVPAHAFDCGPGIYTAQTSGTLAEFTDNVLFSNILAAAYDSSNATLAPAGTVLDVGILAPAKGNVLVPGNSTANPGDLPIRHIQRDVTTFIAGIPMQRVLKLDARPEFAALCSLKAAAPGFFTAAKYRGAFDPKTQVDWQDGWSAADAYGLLDSQAPLDPASDLDICLAGGGGSVSVGLRVNNGPTPGLAVYAYSFSTTPGFPLFGGTLLLNPGSIITLGSNLLDGTGSALRNLDFPSSAPSGTLAFQAGTFNLITSVLGLTNLVSLGHGLDGLGAEGNLTYNDTTGRWRATVTNTTGVAQPIVVEFFDFSASTTTPQTAPATVGANQSIQFQGLVNLEFGDTLIVKCNGNVIATVIG